MEINDFAKMSHARALKHHPGGHPFDAEYFLVALAGEMNELAAKLVKNVWRKGPSGSLELDPEAVSAAVEEAADCTTYGLLIPLVLGRDAEAELLRKYEIVNQRIAAGGWTARPELQPKHTPTETSGDAK